MEFYFFFQRGNMKRGESILIHSGLGGVGQAAIRYALYHGLEVFTTVGSEARKEELRNIFPELKGTLNVTNKISDMVSCQFIHSC